MITNLMRKVKKGVCLILLLCLLVGTCGSVALAYPNERPTSAAYSPFWSSSGFSSASNAPAIGYKYVYYDNANKAYFYDSNNKNRSVTYSDSVSRTVADVINWTAVNSSYGRSNNYALKCEIKNTVMPAFYNESSANPFVMTYQNPNTVALTEGKSTVVSFDIALDDLDTERAVYAKSNNTWIADVSGTGCNLLTIAKGGAVKLIDKDTDLIVKAKKWYNVQIIATAGSADGTTANTCALYVDGKLVKKDVEFDGALGAGMTQMTGFNDVRFVTVLKRNTSEISYVPALTYWDNVYVASYDQNAVYSVVTNSLESSITEINSQLASLDSTIYLSADNTYTATQIKDSFTAGTFKNAYVVNEAGALLSDNDPLIGNYLAITKDTEMFFYKFEQRSATVLSWEQNFDAYSTASLLWQGIAAEAGTTNGATVAPLTYNTNLNQSNYSMVGGLGGKTESDKAFTMSVENYTYNAGNYWRTWADFWTGRYAAAKYSGKFNKKVNLEMSLYFDGDVDYEVDIAESDLIGLVRFTKNKELYLGSSETAPPVDYEIKDKRWYKFNFIYSPGEDFAEAAYINDELVANNVDLTITLSEIARVKCTYMLNEDEANATFAIDNFKITEETFAPSIINVKSSDDSVLISNDEAKLSLADSAIDIFDFTSSQDYITHDGLIKLYADASLSAASVNDFVENGNVLVAHSDDYKIIKYYDVTVNEDGIFGDFSVTSNTSAAITASVAAMSQNPFDAVMLIAEYDANGALVAVSTNKYQQISGKQNLTVTHEKDSSETSFRVMLLRTMNSIFPLKKAKNL